MNTPTKVTSEVSVLRKLSKKDPENTTLLIKLYLKIKKFTWEVSVRAGNAFKIKIKHQIMGVESAVKFLKDGDNNKSSV